MITSGSNRKSAILFDMDGVIVDSMPHHAASWIKILQDEGLTVSETEIYKREGMSGPHSVEDIFISYGLEPPGESILDRIIDRKNQHFKKHTIGLYPSAGELINLLNDKGIKCALVTGSHRVTVDQIIPENLLNLFSAIVTSDDVKNGKPDPEPYLMALQKLDCTAEAAIVVENAPMGIKSAKNAHIYCIALQTTLAYNYLTDADKIILTHDELTQFLKNYI